MRRELQPLCKRTRRRPLAPVQVHQHRCGRRQEDPDVSHEVLQDERPEFRRLHQHVTYCLAFVCLGVQQSAAGVVFLIWNNLRE